MRLKYTTKNGLLEVALLVLADSKYPYYRLLEKFPGNPLNFAILAFLPAGSKNYAAAFCRRAPGLSSPARKKCGKNSLKVVPHKDIEQDVHY